MRDAAPTPGTEHVSESRTVTAADIAGEHDRQRFGCRDRRGDATAIVLAVSDLALLHGNSVSGPAGVSSSSCDPRQSDDPDRIRTSQPSPNP